VHENPDKALSDGPNSLHLSDLAELLRRLLAIHSAARSSASPGAAAAG
jgi:3-deoxy-D-manno-octulosonic acid (KDO) 8-phosphate synthase